MSTRRAVFFDRDGVLNELVERSGERGSPRSPGEVRVVAGAGEALARLRDVGFLVFVVTNQPDVARGFVKETTARRIDRMIAAALPLDDRAMCIHDDADDCDCRKPRPGMIHALAERWSVDVSSSYMVGDRWRDIEAGRAAGCRTVLIRRPYNADVGADLVVDTLEQAVTAVLKETRDATAVGGRACA